MPSLLSPTKARGGIHSSTSAPVARDQNRDMKPKERPAKAKAGKSIKHTKIVVVQQQQKLCYSDPAPPSTFI
jgi:hypothetical protein